MMKRWWIWILLRMPVKVLTSNQIKKLKNDIDSHLKRLKEIKSTTEKMMWLNDINEFERSMKNG
jgi:hypothetical protein